MRRLLSALVVLTATTLNVNCQNEHVQTRLGSLKGWAGLSRGGRQYAAFTRIPYAKPPKGSLRFKSPVEFGQWEGEYDATEDLPLCPQEGFLGTGKLVGTEDCLYLNVYFPKVDLRKLPVLIYIHGGGFKFGHPGPRNMASYIMDENVILVTVTYRLGALGFLSLEEEQLPGNFGLKDQALALKWVKNNIDSFGGDPEMITIMGDSAGGASVHHLLLSPLTRDLMKGGISMSGSVNRVWSLAPTGLMRQRTLKLAERVGCNNITTTLSCLQQLKIDEISVAQSALAAMEGVQFKPTIEPEGPGSLIPDDPLKVPSRKPWLTGITNGEFIFGAFAMHEEMKKLVNNDVDEFLKGYLVHRGVSKGLDSKVKQLKHVYLSGQLRKEPVLQVAGIPVDDFALQMAKCWANMTFVYPAVDNLEMHLGTKYAYHLEYKGEKSIMDKLIDAKTTHIPYASHADELVHLFNLFKNYQPSDSDTKFSKDLIKFFVNFVRYQNPVANDSSVKWKQWAGKEIMRLTAQGYFMADEEFCKEILKTSELWKDILCDAWVKDEL